MPTTEYPLPPTLVLLKAWFNILHIIHIYLQNSPIFLWKPFHPVHAEGITLPS